MCSLPSVLRAAECYEFGKTRDSKFWQLKLWRMESEGTSLSRTNHRQRCIYSVFTFYRWTTEEQRIVCLCISHNAQYIQEDGRRHDNGGMRILSLMSYEIRVSMTTPPNEATECKTCELPLHAPFLCRQDPPRRKPPARVHSQKFSKTTLFTKSTNVYIRNMIQKFLVRSLQI